MNYAEIKPLDVSNSIGISCTLFVSGCTNNCEGCFNKDLQDFNYGKEWTKEVEDYFIECCKNPHVDNICLLGGEIFQQNMATISHLLLRINREVRKPIWAWTGLLYEDLIIDVDKAFVLPFINILIDGRFELDKKDLSLRHRGSANQRIILVRESIEENRVINYEF